MENPITMFQSEDVIMLKWIIINKVEDNEEREWTAEDSRGLEDAL